MDAIGRGAHLISSHLSHWKLAAATGYLIAAFIFCRRDTGSRRPLLWYVGGMSLAVFLSQGTGHDLSQHLAYFDEAFLAWSRGQRAFLTERVFQGGGLPVFFFYSQWIYIPAALFRLFGAAPYFALKLSFAAVFAAQVLGARVLVGFFRPESERAAACVLLFAGSNYFAGEFFQRFAFAETMGYAACIWGLFFALRTIRLPATRDVVALAFFLSVAVLLHPISFAYFLLGAVPFLVFVARGRFGAAALASFALAGAVCVCATAFHWLPILIERGEVTGSVMDFRDSFMGWGDYFSLSRFWSAGPVTAAAFVGSALLLLRGHPDRRAYGALAACSVYLFMMNPASEPLHVSYLADSQLVWRMLSPLCLFTAILAACVLPERGKDDPARTRLWHAAPILQSLIFLSISASPAIFLDGPPPGPADFARRTEGVGVAEFLPPSISRGPATFSAKVIRRTGSVRDETFEIDPAPAGGEHGFPRASAPWLIWEAQGSARVSRAGPDGRAVLALFPGDSSIRARLVVPTYMKVAHVAGGTLFAGMLLFLLFEALRIRGRIRLW